MTLTKSDIEEMLSSLRTVEIDVDDLPDGRGLFEEVLYGSFMREYTKYDSFSEFIKDAPAEVQRDSSFATDEFEKFVESNTVFDDWDEMKRKALEEWIVKGSDI